MPRSGGPSTTAGVLYQALAVACRAIDVHIGRITSVRAEVPPAASFAGAPLIPVSVDDYVVTKDGRRAYYQAKSNAPGGGNWTVNKLGSESVLQDFISQAKSDPTASCHLLTPNACPLLGEIAERARAAASFDEFLKNLSQDQREDYKSFCAHEKVKETEQQGFELLKRFWLEQRSRDALESELERAASVTFVDPDGAKGSLFLLATSWMRTGQEITAALLNEEFGQRAVYRKPAATPRELTEALGAATARLASTPTDIKGVVHIMQPAVGQILSWASGPQSVDKPVAALLDQAGSGKSVAMSVLCKRLEIAGYTVLGIRLDGISFSSADELQRALSLPGPIPAIVQTLKAGNQKVAVLIDQLDALALTYSNQPRASSTIMDLTARLAHLGGVPVVVACRAFDWKYSHQLAELKDKSAITASLPELSAEQVRSVLPAFGIQPNDLHKDTLEVIRSPYRLRLFVEIVEQHRKTDPHWIPPVDKTASLQSLLEEYWQLKMGMAEAEGGLSAACVALVNDVAQYLSEHETLTAPASILDSSRRAADWLRSAGILVASPSGASFFHQTFFDFIFARKFLLTHPSTKDYLVSTDQSLFYRSLVRQLLTHMRVSDRKRYLKEIAELL